MVQEVEWSPIYQKISGLALIAPHSHIMDTACYLVNTRSESSPSSNIHEIILCYLTIRAL